MLNAKWAHRLKVSFWLTLILWIAVANGNPNARLNLATIFLLLVALWIINYAGFAFEARSKITNGWPISVRPWTWPRHGAYENIEASFRANQLLERMLTAEQWESLRRHGNFRVKGGHTGKTYVIDYARCWNVYRLGWFGVPRLKLCCYPENASDLPTGDIIFAQKLWLEGDELRFLIRANKALVS